MTEHRSTRMIGYDYECAERDCGHESPSDCPSYEWDVCERCTALSQAYHEGPLIPWEECWLTDGDQDPCECGCREAAAGAARE